MVLGLALPFVQVPMLILLADRGLMGRAPVRLRTLAVAWSLAMVLITLNLWLVGTA